MIRFAFWLGMAGGLGAATGHAQEIQFSDSTPPAERSTELAPVQVFGSGQQNLNRPLAPKTVDRRKTETYQFTDVNRALKQSSGVYSREEDGQGLRPNIGLRGTNPDRSKKVNIMEDGVLIGPAPYSAPAAYYTPTMNHTESLEIYKGFAGLPYGPNSIGGAINYITPPVPFEPEYKFNLAGGSFNTGNLKISAGQPLEFGGFLLQASRLQTDGFKKLESGESTGYNQNHFLGKLRFDLPGSGHNLLLTSGYSDEDSHETYLGLSEDDFLNDAYLRYPASENDRMKWTQTKLQLRHQLPIGENSALETTAYSHRFHRVWYRLDRFRDPAVNLRDILNSPGGANDPYYDILRGAADSSTLGPTDGQLIIVNNDRTYLSQGIQTRYTKEFPTYGGRHAFEAFARFHTDQIERDHSSDIYNMESGRMVRTADARQKDAINKDLARTVSLYALDNWDIGNWTLTPVLRWENANFEFSDRLTGTGKDRHDSVWLPGLSSTHKFGQFFASRASVNRAATLAGLASDGSERREEAINYEVEFRYAEPGESREASLIFFYNDYQNITGTCTVSSGCNIELLDRTFNGGRARIGGVELNAAKGFYAGAVHMPLQMSMTLLKATFESEFDSTSPDWGVGRIVKGDPLPYVPQIQYSVSFGTEYRAWKQDLTVSYQGRVYDQALQGGREIDPYGIIDWAGNYSFSKRHRLGLKADNVLAREYAVSARPFGLRPGKPQSVQVLWTYQF